MSSDPFKLVTDRRFQELRDEAHRHRLVQQARSDAQRRSATALCGRSSRSFARAHAETAARVPTWMDTHDAPDMKGTNVANPEVDVEAHGLVALHGVRSQTGRLNRPHAGRG